MTRVPHFQTKKELEAYIKGFGIPVERWGRGSAKTVGHLLRELTSGEAALSEEGRTLCRKTEYVAITLTYEDENGEVYELREDRQEFADGRIRRRKFEGSSLYEKIKSDEQPESAAGRAIREELGVGGDVNVGAIGKSEGMRESASYPGLRTRYVRHNFAASMRADQFIPEGYIERQSDKTTFFLWRRTGE